MAWQLPKWPRTEQRGAVPLLRCRPNDTLRRPEIEQTEDLGLREAEPRFCLTRALELETHCTLQVIGAIDVMTERESTVASAGLRRIVNLTDVPAAIRRLTTSLPPS